VTPASVAWLPRVRAAAKTRFATRISRARFTRFVRNIVAVPSGSTPWLSAFDVLVRHQVIEAVVLALGEHLGRGELDLVRLALAADLQIRNGEAVRERVDQVLELLRHRRDRQDLVGDERDIRIAVRDRDRRELRIDREGPDDADARPRDRQPSGGTKPTAAAEAMRTDDSTSARASASFVSGTFDHEISVVGKGWRSALHHRARGHRDDVVQHARGSAMPMIRLFTPAGRRGDDTPCRSHRT
jgi:hypothetical protein